MIAVPQFRPDLAPAEDSRRSSTYLSDIGILNPNMRPRYGASHREHLFTVTGHSFRPDRRRWSVTSLRYMDLNVTSHFFPLQLGRRKNPLTISDHPVFWRCAHITLYHHYRYSQTIGVYPLADGLCKVERELFREATSSGRMPELIAGVSEDWSLTTTFRDPTLGVPF